MMNVYFKLTLCDNYIHFINSGSPTSAYTIMPNIVLCSLIKCIEQKCGVRMNRVIRYTYNYSCAHIFWNSLYNGMFMHVNAEAI
jgi:hypothetical protein